MIPPHLNPAKHAYASPQRGEESKTPLLGERERVRGWLKLSNRGLTSTSSEQ